MPTGIEIAALVATSVQASTEVIKTVLGVLTGARSVLIEIDNNTPLALTRFAHHHDHGGFAALPPLQIAPKAAVVFGSQDKAGSIGTGTEGSVSWAGDGLDMLVGWSNPFIGENSTNVGSNNSGLGGENANRYLVLHQAGVGNAQAHMRFILVIHPPYSLRQSLKEKGVPLKKPEDVFNTGMRALFPGVTNIRAILPNSTAVDLS